MTLIEALKTGKPFRPKQQVATYCSTWYEPNNEMYGLFRQDIVNNDWEVKEPTITITKDQLGRAYFDMDYRQERTVKFFEELCRRLGL